MQKVPTTNQNASVFQRRQTMEQVKSLIAPAWPLKHSVAVNPFHGYTDYSFKKTASLLNRLNGINMYMPFSFYKKMIAEKKLLHIDIQEAIHATDKKMFSLDQILDEVHYQKDHDRRIPLLDTVSDLGEKLTGIKLNDFFTESISNWAAFHFQSKEGEQSKENLFSSWRNYALIDHSASILGIKPFRSILRTIPNDPESAFDYILEKLNLTDEQLKLYLLKLCYKLSGWSAFISGIDWDTNLYGGKTNHLDEFITCLISWEFCILQSFKKQGLEELWMQKIQNSDLKNDQTESDYQLNLKEILQTAFDIAGQRELRNKFTKKYIRNLAPKTPDVQAVFCIDVRSEVFRRNLEGVDSSIQTIGFAGFFGFPLKYKRIEDQETVNQCPVLLPSGPVVKESSNHPELAKFRVSNYQTGEIIKQFKSGAISSFGFVSSLGLFFLPKLLSDSFNLTRTIKKSEQQGYQKPYLLERKIDLSEFAFEDQLNIALSTLTSTGLKEQFSPLVLLVGHGASTVNNPHAAGLACGACGGHSGDINALVAATVFNNPEIRTELSNRGIHIPERTIFLAGLHDTTTDKITILNSDVVDESHQKAFNRLMERLELASTYTRVERSTRLKITGNSIDKDILTRSKDWAQVRPEWGLAGCNSFVIASRTKTKSVNLGGRTFLHDYQFSQDPGLKILEAIMTAPMIVTTWINLQYYASTVDNKHFGAGDKTLHNVTSGIGVLEGSAGDLRIGLPLQSVHNGTEFEHLPQRLNVVIDAPIEAMNDILKKHETIRNLFDNKWIHLFRLNEEGIISDQYTANLEWKSLTAKRKSIAEKQLVTIMD